MSLANVIRSGVAVANKVTSSLQDVVTIRQWIKQDYQGAPTFGKTLKIPAIIEVGEKQVQQPSGVTMAIKATVTFLQPITPNGAKDRIEPLDARDTLTLPDGTSGPVVVLNSIVDPASHKPYFQTVGVGK